MLEDTNKLFLDFLYSLLSRISTKFLLVPFTASIIIWGIFYILAVCFILATKILKEPSLGVKLNLIFQHFILHMVIYSFVDYSITAFTS